jgi:putative toxin-antitoxin system antitoxin component (TIGR02293 family)
MGILLVPNKPKYWRWTMSPIDYLSTLMVADPARRRILCEEGLPLQAFDALVDFFQGSQKLLSGVIGVSKTTLQRRKETHKLELAESERVLRVVRLLDKATRVFGSSENAREWFTIPSPDFEGMTPLEYSKRETGSWEVDAVLDRIAHGVVF